MKWVNSAGGPLLFLDEVLLSDWGGAAGGYAEQSDYERACLAGDLIVSTDYERACLAGDLIVPISISNGCGIVLNDEPLQTAWMPSKKHGQSFFVRLKYAENENSIIRHLEQVPESIFRQEALPITVTSGRCILFDSALPGLDFRKGDFLELMLEPGEHEIRTGFFEPDAETSLVIHEISILMAHI